jgi:hypothetical protein
LFLVEHEINLIEFHDIVTIVALARGVDAIWPGFITLLSSLIPRKEWMSMKLRRSSMADRPFFAIFVGLMAVTTWLPCRPMSARLLHR